MPNFTSFYRGKRVLVTGHTGFMGGWLTAWLKLLGANVIGFALPPSSRPNLFDTAMLDRNMISIFGDVRDRGALTDVFVQQQPEIVIHHAAQALKNRSSSQPVETFATNIMGTAQVLEECRYVRALRAVVVVTSEENAPETAAASGQYEGDFYGASTACAETVTAAYRHSFFNQPNSAAIASAKTANAMAGGDWTENRLIPDIVRGITSEQAIVLEQPDSARSWQHVLEPVRGYLLLAKRLYEDGAKYADGWNFASQEPAISDGELAKRLIALWGAGKLSIQPQTPPAGERHTGAISQKARTDLGWEPLLNLDQALEWTVNWYRAFYENPALGWPIMEAQIQSYMRLAGE